MINSVYSLMSGNSPMRKSIPNMLKNKPMRKSLTNKVGKMQALSNKIMKNMPNRAIGMARRMK